jgi:hypothetical protein
VRAGSGATAAPRILDYTMIRCGVKRYVLLSAADAALLRTITLILEQMVRDHSRFEQVLPAARA